MEVFEHLWVCLTVSGGGVTRTHWHSSAPGVDAMNAPNSNTFAPAHMLMVIMT